MPLFAESEDSACVRVRLGAELALKKRDPQLFWHLATRAFWMRYAGVLLLQDLDSTS